ncbi:MAG: hypothetical protein U0X20_32455 [Caldilineaceae bacterium]
MAGGTKCYKITMVDGKPVREVVSYSPKHADPADVAVAKLTSNPPKSAIVRFHEIREVEQQVTAEPAPLDAPTGAGKTRPAIELIQEMVLLLSERVALLERAIYAIHMAECPDSPLLKGQDKPSIPQVFAELREKFGQYFDDWQPDSDGESSER